MRCTARWAIHPSVSVCPEATARLQTGIQRFSRSLQLILDPRADQVAPSAAGAATLDRWLAATTALRILLSDTQINIAGNKYLHDDFAFGTRDGLIPAVQRISDAREIHKAGLNKPFARIHFDFAVTQEAAGAPTTIVTREHAEAA